MTLKYVCGYEFNLAAAGGAIAGDVLGHFSSKSELAPSTIVQCSVTSLLLYLTLLEGDVEMLSDINIDK